MSKASPIPKDPPPAAKPHHGHAFIRSDDNAIQIVLEAHERPNLVSRASFMAPTTEDQAPRFLGRLAFQVGPVRQYGRNGVTEEALIRLLVSRLHGHQTGDHPSPFNADALHHLGLALGALERRNIDRAKRGVEGTNAV